MLCIYVIYIQLLQWSSRSQDLPSYNQPQASGWAEPKYTRAERWESSFPGLSFQTAWVKTVSENTLKLPPP